MPPRTALPLAAAARVLDVSVVTLRRWIEAGAPVARTGRRGRGGEALLDPAAIVAWQAARGAAVDEVVPVKLRALVDSIPDLIGEIALDRFCDLHGPGKVGLAAELGGLAVAILLELQDQLRAAGVDVAALDRLPESLERLRQIAHR